MQRRPDRRDVVGVDGDKARSAPSLEALLPAGADGLNEVLLGRVAKAVTGQGDSVVAA